MKYKIKYINYKNQIAGMSNTKENPGMSNTKENPGMSNTKENPGMSDDTVIENTTNQKLIKKCDDIITFNNRIGVCWFLAILTIFIYGDSVGNIIQHKLNDINTKKIKISDLIDESNELLLILLEDLEDLNKKTLLNNFILYISEKFQIKKVRNDIIQPGVPIQKLLQKNLRQSSLSLTKNINKIYYDIVKSSKIIEGGYSYDRFFISNILSSILLNKFIKHDDFSKLKKINIELAKSSLGILINVRLHTCCFFNCNNKLRYSSNSLAIKYNWIKLFEKYNELIDNNIIFDIYINFYYDIGPIIITSTDEKFIFKKIKLNKLPTYPFPTYDELQQDKNNSEKYLTLDSFTILSYDENSTELKMNNLNHYLWYYLYYNHPKKLHDTLLNNNCIATINNINYFYYACENGNTEIVEILLATDKSIDYNKDYNGVTPFYIACIKGNTEIVEILLATGKSIDYNKDYNGATPFYIACKKSHIEIVEILLATGKHIDYDRDRKGITPFYYACDEGHTDIVRILLATGKPINYDRDYNDITPFYIACDKGHTEIVNLLLDSDKDIKYNIDYNYKTPFSIACENNHPKIVNLLLNSTKIKYTTNRRVEPPFNMACRKGYTEIVKLLLETDKYPTYNQEYINTTPFFIACENGNTKIVELLLNTTKDIGLNTTCIIKYNEKYINVTPFYIACEKGHTEIVELLLNTEKVIDYGLIFTDLDIVPFYIACEKGHTDIVKLFLNSLKIKNKICDLINNIMQINDKFILEIKTLLTTNCK